MALTLLERSAIEDCSDFIKRVKQVKFLPVKTQVQYITERQNGDVSNSDALIMSLVPQAIKVANLYSKSISGSITMSDILSEAVYSLIYALDRFDVNVGVRPITYVTHVIHRRLQRFIFENKPPLHVPIELQRKIRKAEENSIKTQTPVKIPPRVLPETFQKARMAMSHSYSLDSQKNPNNSEGLNDGWINSGIFTVDPENHEKRLDNTFVIQELLSALEGRDREVIELRFGFKQFDDLPKPSDDGNDEVIVARKSGTEKAAHHRDGVTLTDIAKRYGCSKERVRQIEERALQKMLNYARQNLKTIGDILDAPRRPTGRKCEVE